MTGGGFNDDVSCYLHQSTYNQFLVHLQTLLPAAAAAIQSGIESWIEYTCTLFSWVDELLFNLKSWGSKRINWICFVGEKSC